MEIRTGDGALHAVERGPDDAPLVVLIHGFPFDRRMWSPQLSALADRFRVVAYDVRGLGRSPVGDGQYTMELFVDDFLAVLDAVADGPAVACGLSMGGYILLRALEREPDRFRAAVLADTRSGADDDEAKLGRARAIRTVKEEGAAAYAESFVGGVLGSTTLAERPGVVEAVKEMIRSNEPRGMAGAQLAMLSRTDTTGALAELEMPVLALVGEEDALTPPRTVRAMADRIPDARMEVVPGAGHVASLESPEAFNRVLDGFLDEVA